MKQLLDVNIMKLIAILNREIRSGMAINGLAQMSLGLGHRVKEGMPSVNIFLGTSEQVKEFKRIASAITQRQPTSTIYSAFPLTMEGGDMEALKDRVINTPEEEVVYCGSCFLAPEIDHRFEALLSECLQFANYQPYISDTSVELSPEQDGLNDKADGHKKTTTLINHKLPLAQTLNSIVLANLKVGGLASYDDLHLLTLGPLTHISYNTHPILQPKDPAKHKQMANNAATSNKLVSATESDATGQPLVTVTFGGREDVESVILKAQTRVFSMEFSKEGLVPAIVPCTERAAHENRATRAASQPLSNSSLLLFAERLALTEWAKTTSRENIMADNEDNRSASPGI